ncbi:chemotaxis protein CheB [Mycobacterium sp. MS1601]|uniref:chemotaxis protein CheB n=1 Tax=Mycobacterium sp. MS1601 TaxID=1936029 RepID=UPI001F37F7B6|nr:chemotaxis protein CheB [Mycobacterium sp. MS1601]
MKALRGILETLPGIGEAIGAVVLHRAPDYSPLIEVLQTYTDIPVWEPSDSPWQCPRGALTVAPGGYHLLLGPGRRVSAQPQTSVGQYEPASGVRAHLSLDAPVAYSRPSLNVTFSSAAQLPNPVTAVLLSCANEDGAAGCAAIRAAGGRVVIQDPATCEAPVAVNAALRLVQPDHVADPRGIGEWLSARLR